METDPLRLTVKRRYAGKQVSVTYDVRQPLMFDGKVVVPSEAIEVTCDDDLDVVVDDDLSHHWTEETIEKLDEALDHPYIWNRNRLMQKLKETFGAVVGGGS